MVHSARRARERIAVPVGAFLLLTFGATTMVAAVALLTSNPAIAGAGLIVPGLVAYALAAAGKTPLEEIAGAAPNPGSLVVSLLAGPAIMAAVLVATTQSVEFELPSPEAIGWGIGAAISGELGWRGYFQRLLGSRFPALIAGLLTGVAWGLWQVPMTVSEAGLFPGVGLPDVFAWSIASAILMTALLQIEPRSTWYPIAGQAGIAIYLVMSAIQPARAGSAIPLRMAAVLTAGAGLVALVALRRNTIKGRHRAR